MKSAILHAYSLHDLVQNPRPLWEHVKPLLPTATAGEVIDIGYEVCFFRDAYRANLIERNRALEKQTFDLVLTLSDRSIVLVEARAQQGFGSNQLALMQQARELIIASPRCPVEQVYIAGLFSSRYKPRSATLGTFGTSISWANVAALYPHNALTYLRADTIYSD